MRVLIVGGRHTKLALGLTKVGYTVAVCHEARHASFIPADATPYKSLLIGSTQSVESILGAVRRLGWQTCTDLVIPGGELEVVPASVVGQLLGARSLPLEVAIACRDKDLQKSRWRDARIPTANWALVEKSKTADIERTMSSASINFPCVCKPVDQGGATDVLVAESIPDVQNALLRVAAPLQVETLISTPEWHFDGVVVNAQIERIMVSRYRDPLLSTKSGTAVVSMTFPDSGHPELYEKATGFTQRALSALGLDNGVFHFEAFGDGSNFVAGELACRPGGGKIPEVASYVLGLDIWHTMGLITAGCFDLPRRPENSEYFGFAILPATGERSLVDLKPLLEDADLLLVESRTQVGETMSDSRVSTGNGMGYIIAKSRNLSGLVDKLEYSLSKVSDAYATTKARST